MTIKKMPKQETTDEIVGEYGSVVERFPRGFDGSYHRAYGVLAEEFKELEAELFKKPRKRDKQRIRREACQVAVTAILIMEELGK